MMNMTKLPTKAQIQFMYMKDKRKLYLTKFICRDAIRV